ncbi:MAG: metalloregulator ArsR/SmtB family transcription factor [Longimicrobiales bacterium]
MPDVFDALADPTRRTILDRLRAASSLSVSELSEPLAMSRQAVTKHLDVLEDAGLVQHRRVGRERRHRLVPEPLRDVDDWLAPYAAAWDHRLERLRRHLDETPHDEEREDER